MRTTEEIEAQLYRVLPPDLELEAGTRLNAVVFGGATGLAEAEATVEQLMEQATIGGGEDIWLKMQADDLAVQYTADQTDEQLRVALRNIQDKVTPVAIVSGVNALLATVTDSQAYLVDRMDGTSATVEEAAAQEAACMWEWNAFWLYLPELPPAEAPGAVEEAAAEGDWPESWLRASLYDVLEAEVDRLRAAGIRVFYLQYVPAGTEDGTPARYPTDSYDVLVWRLNGLDPEGLGNSGTAGSAGDLVLVAPGETFGVGPGLFDDCILTGEAPASSDYLFGAAAVPLPPDGALTFSLWFKPALGAQGLLLQHYRAISEFYGGSQEDSPPGLFIDAGGTVLLSWLDGEVGAGASFEFSPVPETWNFLAVVVTSSEVQLYLNGVLVDTAPFHGEFDWALLPGWYLLGNDTGNWSAPPSTCLEEVRIATTARGADWVDAVYQAGTGQP